MHRFEPLMRPFHTPNLGGDRSHLGAALGQGPSSVSFAVRNKAGEPIPGAVITITHGGRVRSWTTDEAGKFDIMNLAINPGDAFHVSVAASGYKTQEHTLFTLPRGATGLQVIELEREGVSDLLVGAGILAALGVGYALFG